MRNAEAAWPIVRGDSEKATGELIDTETVMISSEGGRWKSTHRGNSLAAYPTARPVLNGEDEETGYKALRLVLTQHRDAMEVFARTERHQWQPCHPLHDCLQIFARWADDGSLWQAFVASVAHLSAEKQLDLSVLHGDGTNTVAKKGGMVLGIRGTNTRGARKSSR